MAVNATAPETTRAEEEAIVSPEPISGESDAEQASIEKKPRSQKRRLPRGEVRFFENWCKGCGLCVEFCPSQVLALGQDSHPLAIYPEKCTACRWCEMHCPDFAIFIVDIPEQNDPEENTP